MALPRMSIRRGMVVIAVAGLDCGLWRFWTGRTYIAGVGTVVQTIMLAVLAALLFQGWVRRFAVRYAVSALSLLGILFSLSAFNPTFARPVVRRYDAYVQRLSGTILAPAMTRVDLSPTHIEYRVGWTASVKFETMVALPIVIVSVVGGLLVMLVSARQVHPFPHSHGDRGNEC